ncbi:uncharacterized protein [Fopius arisanus]|uniref:SO_1163_0 protein n=1 Tax=Fopius arisanus TaxID=64838 RepID=A0A0C9PKA7_9HYME|nr:PREDICTED: uncharacterized protein LOC105268928 isoform X2 [Fopius arisanus]XP_011307154.1 PREDICTED: uncharacterized protein LOC105268928 isoform X2 [Fopius arisanus]
MQVPTHALQLCGHSVYSPSMSSLFSTHSARFLPLMTAKPEKWHTYIGKTLTHREITSDIGTKVKRKDSSVSLLKHSVGRLDRVFTSGFFSPSLTIDLLNPASHTKKYLPSDLVGNKIPKLNHLKPLPKMPPIKSIIWRTSKTKILSKGAYPEVSSSFQSCMELCTSEERNTPGGHPLHKDTFNSTQPSPLSKHQVGNDPPTSSIGDDIKPPPETNFSPISTSSPFPAIHQLPVDTLTALKKNLYSDLPNTTKMNYWCSLKKLSTPLFSPCFYTTRVAGDAGDSETSRCVVEFEKKSLKDCSPGVSATPKTQKHLPYLTPVDKYKFNPPSRSVDIADLSDSRPNIQTVKQRLSRSLCITHKEWIKKCKPLPVIPPPKPKRKSRGPVPLPVLPMPHKSGQWRSQKYCIRERVTKCSLVKSSIACPSGMESALGETPWIPAVTDIPKKGRSKTPLERIPQPEGNLCCHLRKCQNLKNYEMKMEESRDATRDNKKR